MYRRRSRHRASLNSGDHRCPPCHGDRSTPPAPTRHHRKPKTDPTSGSGSSSISIVVTPIAFLVVAAIVAALGAALGRAVLLLRRPAFLAEAIVPAARRRCLVVAASALSHGLRGTRRAGERTA